jgi:hypothetical protein
VRPRLAAAGVPERLELGVGLERDCEQAMMVHGDAALHVAGRRRGGRGPRARLSS